MSNVANSSTSVETGYPATMHTGPLGSTIHVIRADAGTVAELAAIDWNRSFGRVCLDPVRGLITLMAPSRLHDELATILDHIVDVAASALGGAVKGLLTARLREPGAPPGTGMEPDCAFYVGERARAYRAALAAGRDAADAFFESNAPDLVVEVEITNADEGKVERYADLGVRELWRLDGRANLGGPSRGVPRPASRDDAPPARLLERPPEPDARRRPRGGHRHAPLRHPRRAHGSCRPHRAPPAARQRPRAGGDHAVRRSFQPSMTVTTCRQSSFDFRGFAERRPAALVTAFERTRQVQVRDL